KKYSETSPDLRVKLRLGRRLRSTQQKGRTNRRKALQSALSIIGEHFESKLVTDCIINRDATSHDSSIVAPIDRLRSLSSFYRCRYCRRIGKRHGWRLPNWSLSLFGWRDRRYRAI